MMSLALLVFSAVSIPLPKWPQQYHLKGTWNIPYWQIRQPFVVETDNIKGYQAELAYGGISHTINVFKKRKFTIQTSPKGLDCFFTEKDPKAEDSFISYLPSGDDWKYIGEQVVLGKPAHAWRRDVESAGWYYVFYTDMNMVPLRYFQHGQSIRHSHPADYIFDIDEFGPTANQSAFMVPTDTCRNMSADPGPQVFANDISTPKKAVDQTKCPVMTPTGIEQVPTEFSWRQVKGVVPTVRDQANCGSCWAQAASEAISSQFSIRKRGNVTVSVQQIIDCVWVDTSMACAGGEGFDAFDFLLQKKIPIGTEEEYPYLGVSGYCQQKIDNQIGYVTGCHQVNPNDYVSLKKALFKFGPLMVYIKAGFTEFVQYKKGAFNNPKCKVTLNELDHGVLLTGWKIVDGVETWEIMNSWSTMWGDEGFAYIAAGENDCGVSLMALFPDVEII